MPRYRFVDPETIRIALSDDDWIEVKKSLNHGEAALLKQSAFKPMQQIGGEASIQIDFPTFEIERIRLWVLDWSFRDHNDKSVKIDKASIAKLDSATAEEIIAAIDAHVEAMDKEKKQKIGTTTPKPS